MFSKKNAYLVLCGSSLKTILKAKCEIVSLNETLYKHCFFVFYDSYIILEPKVLIKFTAILKCNHK